MLVYQLCFPGGTATEGYGAAVGIGLFGTLGNASRALAHGCLLIHAAFTSNENICCW